MLNDDIRIRVFVLDSSKVSPANLASLYKLCIGNGGRNGGRCYLLTLL